VDFAYVEKNVMSVKPISGSYTEIELAVQVSYGYDDFSGKLNKLTSVMMAQEAVLNFEIVEVDKGVAGGKFSRLPDAIEFKFQSWKSLLPR